MGIGLATLATCFVLVCGANDGGALLALAVRHGEVSTFGVLGLAEILSGEIAGPVLKRRELLRRLDVVGLRMAECADAMLRRTL